MLNFLTLKPESFGLDISDLSLKIARLKKRGGFFSLASWIEQDIDSGIVVEGEIKKEEALVKLIKQALLNINGGKIKTKNVIASLPEQKGFLQVIQVPRMTKEELKIALPLEAENYIPFPLNEIYMDFQVVVSSQQQLDHMDVLISAAPKDISNAYVSCLRKSGLSPLSLEIESQAIARATIKNETNAARSLIVDFGKSSTSFIIFAGDSIRFTTSIPISSQMLTEAISKNLKIDLKEAEKLKILYGLSSVFDKSGPNQKKKNLAVEISKSLIPILTDLVEQIKKYIDYYQDRINHEHIAQTNKKIEKILLCGKGTNLKGFADFISSSLAIPAVSANPWINILPEHPKNLPQLSFKESLGYTTALGLALRGFKE